MKAVAAGRLLASAMRSIGRVTISTNFAAACVLIG